jgi:hypothetical protein
MPSRRGDVFYAAFGQEFLAMENTISEFNRVRIIRGRVEANNLHAAFQFFFKLQVSQSGSGNYEQAGNMVTGASQRECCGIVAR